MNSLPGQVSFDRFTIKDLSWNLKRAIAILYCSWRQLNLLDKHKLQVSGLNWLEEMLTEGDTPLFDNPNLIFKAT